MASVIDALRRHAAERPEDTLYTFLDGRGEVTESYTCRSMDERSTDLAGGLLAAGCIAPGDRVLLVYPPGLEFIAAFYACVKAGAVPVPVAPPDGSGFVGGIEKLAYIAADAAAVAALTTADFQQQLQRLAERSPDGDAWLRRPPLSALRWQATDQVAGAAVDLPATTDPLLFLQYTSGSTQQPRGVMVSHDNVLANCAATLQHRPVGVSWLPHYHDMGLIGYYLFIMIAGGSTVAFSGSHFLRRPALWLETITRFGGTITSAPNFAFEYCLREDKVPESKLAGLDLSSLVCMMNASEPVRASTFERFQARFGPCGLSPRAHMVYYGLAENTLSVTGDGRVALTVNTGLLERNQLKVETPRADGTNQSRIMSCGRPLADVEVRIVAPDTAVALADGDIGEVWLSGPSKTGGYRGKTELSANQFEARLDGYGATYLRTGDIGFLHDGELFLCGRLKDLIIVNGRNHYPADIEAVIEAASPKVRQGCVAAFGTDDGLGGEGIAVLLEARRGNALPDLEALCQAVRQRCQVDVTRMAVVPHGTIPKTSSGKISRQLCRRTWEAGGVTVLAERERSLQPNVDQLLEDLLSRFGIGGQQERTLADLGIDSLTLVELSLYLERLFESRGGDGWEQAAEAWSDLRVLQAITVGEVRAYLAAFAAGEELPDTAPQLIAGRVAAIERDELALMRADARLAADVAPRAAAPLADGDTVLLTGVTGFLGAFLLEALLRLTSYRVVALVRAADDDHALRRARAGLERTGHLDAGLDAAFAKRVHALPGDLAAPDLGLEAATTARLADEVGAIFHCGAEVDYVRPYAHLRAANVVATADLVRFAARGRPKAMHYVSTTFMFGFVARQVCREDDANLEMQGLNFGYAQSKWVAEQVVFDAAARGQTTRVYRPSLVTASRHGHYVRRDLMARILAYTVRHGTYPDIANQLSFVPVDVCANNIVALSLLADAAPVVHITADDVYSLPDVCGAIQTEHGYDFEPRPMKDFMAYLNANCPVDDPMYALLAFFNDNWRRIESMRDKRYDNAGYRAARARSDVAQPQPSLEATVSQIVAFLQAEGLVPASPATVAAAG